MIFFILFFVLDRGLIIVVLVSTKPMAVTSWILIIKLVYMLESISVASMEK